MVKRRKSRGNETEGISYCFKGRKKQYKEIETILVYLRIAPRGRE